MARTGKRGGEARQGVTSWFFAGTAYKKAFLTSKENMMLDINKMVAQEQIGPSMRGHLVELDSWTEDQAIAMARRDGLELTDDHFGIIRYLRDCYADHGGTINARLLMRSLEEEFAGLGGHKFLYNLFPLGPVAQATRYAGLPMPPGTRDPSFGTTH
jgi:TusE/DsrC/DsvC family sulfur relay protein